MKQKITRIDNFDSSNLPWYLAAFNHYCAAPVNHYARLSVSELMQAAKRKTNLVDFGETSFLRPLQQLITSLEKEAQLSALGRLSVREYIIQLLVNRLRIEDLIKRYPVILNESIEQTFIIADFPNPSATRIFNLLALDKGCRTLSYWESLEPVASEKDRAKIGARDRRIKRAQRSWQLLEKVLPDFGAMNEYHRRGPHEEAQLLALSFSTPLFENYYDVPSYSAWFKSSDREAAYLYLKRVLQVLQWQQGSQKRWVLKATRQAENINAFSSVFPNAKYIQVRGGTAIEEFSRPSEEGQIFNFDASDSANDNFTMVKMLYQFLQQPLTTETVIAMQSFMAQNPSGKYDNFNVKLQQFGINVGISAAGLRDALKFYQKQIQLV